MKTPFYFICILGTCLECAIRFGVLSAYSCLLGVMTEEISSTFMFRKLSAFALEQKNVLSTGAWSRATQAFCRFSTPTSVEFESSVSSKKVRAEVAIKFSNFGQNFPTAAKLSNFRRNFLPYIRNLLATRSIIDPYYFIFQQLSSTNA